MGTANIAAMRDALENIAEYAKSAACHTEDAHVLSFLDQIANWAKSALAAPPRNCDKYNDHKTAVYAYLADCNKRGIAPHWAEAIRWLLSPATEQKGDADESK